jgi:glycerol-3-phosphate dehydrogenase
METVEFSPATRKANIERMKSDVFDIVVIGGGITGAGIARDAALRGLTVALVERNDFASGTSSKSARMVHGGLRYLENYQFGLVMSACAERYKLHKLAPRLVRPTAFTFPVFRKSRNGFLKIRLGMWLYDLMALFRNVGRHRMLRPQQVAALEPVVPQQELVGAAYYYDCLADDARLTLATIQSAHQYGALIANHAEVSGLLKDKGRVTGINVVDRVCGEPFSVRARATVNATGVWADNIRRMDDSSAEKLIRANRGIHLVLPRSKLPINGAVAFTSPDGKRAMYAVPWGETAIIGTTDTDHPGDLDVVYATATEVESILLSTNHAFPGTGLTLDDIISTYAGLRPLLGDEEKAAYQVSRDHQIYESNSGLLSIAGGKLTTYRKMAEDLVDQASKKLETEFGIRAQSNTRSDQTPLVDITFDPEWELATLAESYHQFDDDILAHLVRVYGPACPTVLAFIEGNADMGSRIVPGLPYIRAEIPYAVRYEMALTLSDFMIRRTHIIHEDKKQGVGCMSDIAQVMAQHLGWSSEETEQQTEQYRREVELSRTYLSPLLHNG